MKRQPDHCTEKSVSTGQRSGSRTGRCPGLESLAWMVERQATSQTDREDGEHQAAHARSGTAWPGPCLCPSPTYLALCSVRDELGACWILLLILCS